MTDITATAYTAICLEMCSKK